MRLTIERLGHLGDGVAPGPIYVAGALPGEVVEGALAGDRLEGMKIVEPSVARVAAECPHYRSCGGCSLMHVRPQYLADWKVEVVRQSLGDLAATAAFRPIVTSPERSRRRATLAGRRTKSGAIVGFHGRASGTIVEIPQCRLLHPALVAAIEPLRAIVIRGASRKGEVDLTISVTESGLDLAVRGGKPDDATLIADLSGLARSAGLARITWDGDPLVTRDPPLVRFDGVPVILPPGGFMQATAEGEAALVAAVRDAVGNARRIVDLFAGCGTFALPLASGANVHAVEHDRAMLAALDAGWRAGSGRHLVTTEARDLFRRPLMPDELKGFDAAVIDPPRAGAEAQTEGLARSALRRVAAVSCNPVTLARDARILVDAGFRIEWVQVVDQFRWSPHVETVALFSR